MQNSIKLMQNGIEEKSHNELINFHPTPKNDKIQAIKKSLKDSNLADTTCIKWWGQIDKVRTFLLESVKYEDSFLRTLKIA